MKKELLALAERLGIEVRFSPIAPSGLCSIKGEQVLYINTTLDSSAVVEFLIHELRKMNIDDIYILPGLRAALEKDGGDDV